MRVLGFGLFEQRTVNAFWAAAAIALAAGLLYRRVGWSYAVGLVGLFALSSHWMHYTHIGKTYALVALLSSWAAWVWMQSPTGPRKLLLLAFIGTLAVGSRLAAAPFFGLLWLAALWECWSQRSAKTGIAVAASGLLPLVLLGPFVWVAPEVARFWMWDWFVLSVPLRDFRVSIAEALALAPVLGLGLIAGAIWTIKHERPIARTQVLMAASLVALFMNVGRSGSYAEYGVMFLPVLAVSIALWGAVWLRGLNARQATLLGAIAISFSVVASVALRWNAILPERNGTYQMLVPASAAEFEPTLIFRLDQARAVVREFLPPDAPFWGPKIILAAETGNPVPANNRMGPFSATSEYTAAEAAHLNLLRLEQIKAAMRDPAVPLIGFSTIPKFNYLWSVPTFSALEGRNNAAWMEMIGQHFLIAYQDRDFLLLVRKPPEEGPPE